MIKGIKKGLLLIKWENIALFLFIPLAIIQFSKAHIDFKLVSVLTSLTLYGGTYLTIYVSRKEALEELKHVKVISLITLLNNLSRAIKKEIIIQANIKTTKPFIKACFLK